MSEGWRLNVDDIIDYESGNMDLERLVEFFQGLIDSGTAWKLQGQYGRMAEHLIEEGHCFLKKES